MHLRRTIKALLLAALLTGMVGCGATSPLVLGSNSSALSAKAHKPGELELQVFPEATLDRFLNSIKGAKKSIQMQMYMLTLDSVVTELINAANRGVTVQVMLESNPFNPENPASPLPTNRITARKFQGTKVQLAWTDPTFNFTHSKCVLIDDEAWILSLNLTKSGSEGNREFAIIDRSPSDVAELKRIFKSDWIHDPYTPKDPDLVVSPVNSRQQIMDTMKSAKQELIIGVEVAGDPETDAIIKDRLQAGAKVKVILGHYKKVDCNLEIGRRWQALGAEVRFIAKPFYHAKYLLADGKKGYMGSVHLTTNSMDKNREIGVIIGNEQALLGKFKE
ncbi:MAG: phospholipase D-like domain-containing protein, partial [Bacteroidota bacterium]